MTTSPAQRKKIRENKIKNFDPDKKNNISGGIFGLPFETEESELIIIPVPWDVSSSKYGSCNAPEAILTQSANIELYNSRYEDVWKNGIAMHNIPQKWKESSIELRKIQHKVLKMKNSKNNGKQTAELIQQYKNLNYSNLLLKEWIEDKCKEYLNQKKIVGLLGGDKSVISGLVHELAKKHKSFGVLYLDAHAGLKEKNNGFDYSHDSVVFKHLSLEQISCFVLAGTRSWNYAEAELIQKNNQRIKLYSDDYLKEKLFKGTTWRIMINEIISSLPRYVYLSVDADVMQQYLCPDTAMPVAGGFSFEELSSLIWEIQQVGKKIIGFDLTGVSHNKGKEKSWDADVGAQLLYHLSFAALKSNQK